MSDVLKHFDSLVTRHKPARIVLYEGDNDISSGKTVDTVFAHYESFFDRVAQELPGTKVAILAVKPSLKRLKHLPDVLRLNERLRSLANARGALFIDVCTPLLDDSGSPLGVYFKADDLHLNKAGYALWESILKPVLEDWARAPR